MVPPIISFIALEKIDYTAYFPPAGDPFAQAGGRETIPSQRPPSSLLVMPL